MSAAPKAASALAFRRPGRSLGRPSPEHRLSPLRTTFLSGIWLLYDGKRDKRKASIMLDTGDTAPDFSLVDPDGNPVQLSGSKAKYKVVYFYPKDDTSGCTKEAIDFTPLKPEFEKLGAEVIGISPDSSKSHAKFRDKHGLKVTLLADPEKKAIQAYGAWIEKKMYGKTYMGVDRST
jgi:peroxiredoxin Q/BCP